MVELESLENKIRNFIQRRVELWEVKRGNFDNEILKIALSTRDNNVLDNSFCLGYMREKYVLAAAVQAGCAVGCQFCEIGDMGYRRNLMSFEILDELAMILNMGVETGFDIYQKPLKAAFVAGGDPLLNPHLYDVMAYMMEHLPIQLKISTVFPNTPDAYHNFTKIVEAASVYPNIMQLQISLGSTDKSFRKNNSRVELADFSTIARAGKYWMENVPNPRKINLSFTVHSETPMDLSVIRDVLLPEIFNIRIRAYNETDTGRRNMLERIDDQNVNYLTKMVQEEGYTVIPRWVLPAERKYELSTGMFIKGMNYVGPLR